MTGRDIVRKAARALSPSRFADVCVETYWSSGIKRPIHPEPSWQLDRDKLSRVVIEWPVDYQWKPFRRWLEPLVAGFSRFVTVRRTETPQGTGIIVPRFLYDGKPYHVVVDQSDYLDFIDEDWAKRSLVYFKMQFDEGGYAPASIVPGGFIPHGGELYGYLPYLRSMRNAKAYVNDVFSRFSLEFAADFRRALHGKLSTAPFAYVGGPKKVRYSRFLRDAARSRICIDVPGNADVCCRQIDYFAVGAFVIGFRPRTVFHVPVVDGEHIVYANPDLSDLLSLCERYLADDARREQIADNARRYFDAYMHRDQIAAYYLKTFLDRLP